MIKPHHIDEAYQWLCQEGRNNPDNADIWHLRFHWATERTRLLQALSERNYNFAPLQVITKADGTIIHLWTSPDALVLKALTLAIAPLLPISRRCTHVKGHGGLKYAVREVQSRDCGLGRHVILPYYKHFIRRIRFVVLPRRTRTRPRHSNTTSVWSGFGQSLDSSPKAWEKELAHPVQRSSIASSG